MPRQLAGRDQNRVKTDIANSSIGIGGEPDFRRCRDPLLLPLGDRFCCAIERRPRFHFDEYQRVAARGDDVDLTSGLFQRRAKRR